MGSRDFFRDHHFSNDSFISRSLSGPVSGSGNSGQGLEHAQLQRVVENRPPILHLGLSSFRHRSDSRKEEVFDVKSRTEQWHNGWSATGILHFGCNMSYFSLILGAFHHIFSLGSSFSRYFLLFPSLSPWPDAV